MGAPPSENYKTCLVCLQHDSKSKSSKFGSNRDNLQLELELTTLAKLFDLKTNLKSNVDLLSLCQRCCHTLQRVHHQMAELQCLEKQIENSKKEIKDRMINYTTTNLTGLGLDSPFNPFYAIRDQVKKEIVSCSLLSLIKRKETCSSTSTKSTLCSTSICKVDKAKDPTVKDTSTSAAASTAFNNKDKLKLCKKSLQVHLVPLNIPVHPRKSYILLDQLSKSVKTAQTQVESKCPPPSPPSSSSPRRKETITDTDTDKILIRSPNTAKLSINFHHGYKYKTNGLHCCPECGKGYKRLDHLELHKNLHTGVTPYKCDVDENCTLSFATKTLRVLHRLTHKNKKIYPCDVCLKSFRTSYQLELHRNINHTGNKPFKCEEDNCTLAFPTKTLRHLHKLSDHKKSRRRHSCPDCPRTFKKLSTFETHCIYAHKYSCSICKIYFSTNAQLTKHSREVHNLEAFQCHICNHQSASQKWLNNHIYKIHKKPNNSTSTMPTKIKRKYVTRKMRLMKNPDDHYHYEQKYKRREEKCGKCEQVFENFDDLEAHLLTHLMSSRASTSSTDSTFVPDNLYDADDDIKIIETQKESFEDMPVLDAFESGIINRHFGQPSTSNVEAIHNQEKESGEPDPLRIDLSQQNQVNVIDNYQTMNQANYQPILYQNQTETGHQTLISTHKPQQTQVFLNQLFQSQTGSPGSRPLIAILIPQLQQQTSTLGSINQFTNNMPNNIISSHSGSVDSQLPISIIKSYSVNKLNELTHESTENLKIRKERYEQCPICKKVLSSSLKRHIQVVHEKLKIFHCQHPGCEESFATPQQRKSHIALYHLCSQVLEESVSTEPEPGQKENEIIRMDDVEISNNNINNEIDLLVEKSFENTEFDNILGL